MKWHELRYTAWSGVDVAEGWLAPSALGGPPPARAREGEGDILQLSSSELSPQSLS